MRSLCWVLGIVLLWAPRLAAQDSTGEGDSVVRQHLQRQIEQRFSQVVQRQLGLTDGQMTRLKATEERFRPRRQAIMRRSAAAHLALQAQMRPGQAADADSVRNLMDAMQANRAELLRMEEDEDQEMLGYLTPVQLARFKMLRERLLQRLQEVRRERMRRRGLGGGGGQQPRLLPDGPGR
jgi:hypothetical protein